jgi:hypothetical protein
VPAGGRKQGKDTRFAPRGAKPTGAKSANRRFPGKKNFKPRP